MGLSFPKSTSSHGCRSEFVCATSPSFPSFWLVKRQQEERETGEERRREAIREGKRKRGRDKGKERREKREERREGNEKEKEKERERERRGYVARNPR